VDGVIKGGLRFAPSFIKEVLTDDSSASNHPYHAPEFKNKMRDANCALVFSP
jgi:hypothetical protein